MIPIAYTPDFEKWYDLYPRKKHKQEAARAFKTLLTIRSVEFLCRVTAVYKKCTDQWPRDQRKYIPDPATWLNKGGYDDDHAVWREKIPKDSMAVQPREDAWYRQPPPPPLTDEDRAELATKRKELLG